MQRNKLLGMAASIGVAIAIGFVAGSRRDSDRLTVPVVRTYVVQPERTDEIKTQLNKMFEQKDGDPTGRAQAFSNGIIIVRAPEGFQHGISRLVEQLSGAKSPPQDTIHIDYWIVIGQEDKDSNVAAFPALTGPLSAITKIDGARKFRVFERASSISTAAHEVQNKGSNVKTVSTSSYANDLINLKVDIDSKLGGIKADTMVKPGEFVILGQNAVDPDALVHGPKMPAVPANVYYIIRAELAK